MYLPSKFLPSFDCLLGEGVRQCQWVRMFNMNSFDGNFPRTKPDHVFYESTGQSNRFQNKIPSTSWRSVQTWSCLVGKRGWRCWVYQHDLEVRWRTSTCGSQAESEGAEDPPRTPPDGDTREWSQGNRVAEVGVREIKRQCRALLFDYQNRLGRAVEAHHPSMVWCILWLRAYMHPLII